MSKAAAVLLEFSKIDATFNLPVGIPSGFDPNSDGLNEISKKEALAELGLRFSDNHTGPLYGPSLACILPANSPRRAACGAAPAICRSDYRDIEVSNVDGKLQMDDLKK